MRLLHYLIGVAVYRDVPLNNMRMFINIRLRVFSCFQFSCPDYVLIQLECIYQYIEI